MERVWNLKKQGDSNDVKHLSAALNINMVLARLLVQRGIKTFNEAKAFFRPRLSDLHDPFLMKDMDKAVANVINPPTPTGYSSPVAIFLIVFGLGTIVSIRKRKNQNN